LLEFHNRVVFDLSDHQKSGRLQFRHMADVPLADGTQIGRFDGCHPPQFRRRA